MAGGGGDAVSDVFVGSGPVLFTIGEGLGEGPAVVVEELRPGGVVVVGGCDRVGDVTGWLDRFLYRFGVCCEQLEEPGWGVGDCLAPFVPLVGVAVGVDGWWCDDLAACSSNV